MKNLQVLSDFLAYCYPIENVPKILSIIVSGFDIVGILFFIDLKHISVFCQSCVQCILDSVPIPIVLMDWKDSI